LTAEQKNAVVRLANLQKNFGRIMNSPGVELSLREVKRSRTSVVGQFPFPQVRA
jgi:hypothetical protein